MTKVTVVGSINVDLIFTAARLPGPGETIGGGEFATAPGGKGANQALAAQRMGGDVTMVGRVGDDPWSETALELLKTDEVTLSVSTVPSTTTGLAMIVVDSAGENQIVVAPGANTALNSDVTTPPGDVLLCQLEIPVGAVAAAINQFSGQVILNAAPAEPFTPNLLDGVEYLIVNESEQSLLEADMASFGGVVVTTLGANGAVATRGGVTLAQAPSPRVDVVDTVGAGDAFCGAFAVAIGERESLEEALRIAVTAGALATTKPGAQPSLPTRSEVLDQFSS